VARKNKRAYIDVSQIAGQKDRRFSGLTTPSDRLTESKAACEEELHTVFTWQPRPNRLQTGAVQGRTTPGRDLSAWPGGPAW
jgi:hypothetical protein